MALDLPPGAARDEDRDADISAPRHALALTRLREEARREVARHIRKWGHVTIEAAQGDRVAMMNAFERLGQARAQTLRRVAAHHGCQYGLGAYAHLYRELPEPDGFHAVFLTHMKRVADEITNRGEHSRHHVRVLDHCMLSPGVT